MEPIDPQDRLQVSPEVLFTQVGDEAVLLDRNSGVYYSLDPVGTLVWAEIVRGETLYGIQLAVNSQFSADLDVIWADLLALLTDLKAKGLVTILRS
jgi:hypothetical protein